MIFLKKPERRSALENGGEQPHLDTYSRQREMQPFTSLFERYAKKLYEFCHGFLNHEEDSRDTVMYIFSKSLEHASRKSIHNFESWLFYLARNECINRLRQRERLHEEQFAYIYQEKNDPDRVALEENAQEEAPELLLGRALSRLRREQRICIELFYFENKRYREIAQLTGYSVKEVKSNLQNGRRKLKKLLLTVRNPDSYL